MKTAITIDHIEAQALELADARDALATTIDAMQGEIDEINKRYRPTLIAGLRDVQTQEATLLASVRDSKELFKKPRSRVLHGIKFGWQQGKGKLEWDGDEALVKRIKEQLSKADQDLCVQVTEKPRRDALSKLKAKVLAGLGVKVVDAADAPFVKQASSDLDKVIKSLAGDLNAEGEGDE